MQSWVFISLLFLVLQNEARKANQQAMVAEKKRMEPRAESRGVSKQKWLEDRKKKIGKLLDSNGLDMTKSYMLDTQESAEAKYKKWEKEPAPYGWDGEFHLSNFFIQFIFRGIFCSFGEFRHIRIHIAVSHGRLSLWCLLYVF